MRAKTITMLMISVLLLLGISYAASASAVSLKQSQQFNQINPGLVLYANCQLTASQNLINNLTEHNVAATSNLSNYGSSISSIKSQLAQNSTNQSEINSQINGKIPALMSQIRAGVLDGVGKKAISESANAITQRSIRDALRQNITTLITPIVQGYQACRLSALRSYALGKVSAYKARLSKLSSATANLSASGIDIAPLDAIISGANKTIVTPLQSAISSASNSNQIIKAIDKYCLYDGCNGGVNYHLDAKYDAQKAALIAGSLNTSSGDFNVSDVQASQALIENAISMLATIGPSAYSANQQSAVYSDINQSIVELKKSITQVG